MVAHRASSHGSRIRRLAAAAEVVIMPTKQAARRLNEEGISLPDAQMALCTCSIIRSETRHGQWRRTIKGQDAEGGTIQLVIVVDPTHSDRIIVLSGKRVK